MPINPLVEGKVENDQNAAPHCRNTTVDQYEHIELVMAEEMIDEPSKSTSTILEVENTCQGRLVLGLLFLAAATCLMVGTPVLQSKGGRL